MLKKGRPEAFEWEEVKKAAEKLYRLMGIIEKNMKFSIDEKTHQVTVEVMDSKIGKVLGEIPARSILDLLGSFSNMAGLLLDKYS